MVFIIQANSSTILISSHPLLYPRLRTLPYLYLVITTYSTGLFIPMAREQAYFSDSKWKYCVYYCSYTLAIMTFTFPQLKKNDKVHLLVPMGVTQSRWPIQPPLKERWSASRGYAGSAVPFRASSDLFRKQTLNVFENENDLAWS